MIMTSLLGWVSAGTALFGVGVVGSWTGKRRDALGRPRPFPVWSVSVLTLLSVGALIPGAQRHMEERRLASVASQLVGHKVAVACQTTTAALVDAGAELGFVPYDENGIPLPRTLIKRDPCKALRAYLGGQRGNPTQDEVIAVHILTHEAMHMRGETSEAAAECQAVQRDRTTASLLGASPEQAQRLARTYWLTVYPNMPEGYFSNDCGPGRPMDESLTTAPWVG